MKSQDEKSLNKADKIPAKTVTGSHIAPKGHGAACPCCLPPECDDDEDE